MHTTLTTIKVLKLQIMIYTISKILSKVLRNQNYYYNVLSTLKKLKIHNDSNKIFQYFNIFKNIDQICF